MPVAPAAASGLPAEIERAVQALERLMPERLGAGAGQVLRRLLPRIGEAQRARMMKYKDFHRRSIADREGFWAEQAQAHRLAQAVRQGARLLAPAVRAWFVGGETNLCHNAVDRHLAARGDQKALIYISTETGEEKSLFLPGTAPRGEPAAPR